MNTQYWTQKDRAGYELRLLIERRRKYKAARKKDRIDKFTDELANNKLNKINAGKIDTGFIYIIVNDSFSGWYKIGTCVDLAARLSVYQTSDPHRGYKILKSWVCNDRKNTETVFLSYTERSPAYETNGEWVKPKSINKLEQDILTFINNPVKITKELKLKDNWVLNKQLNKR